MISLEAYRAAIGNFYFTAKKLGLTRGKEASHNQRFSSVSCYSLLLKLLLPNLIMVFLNMLLLRSGDVESNPGPPISVVRGSYHQADSRFGRSAGTQCMCNALFSLCYSVTRKACHWASRDLDYVLNMGDALYKDIGLYGVALEFEELPNTIMIENVRIPVRKTYLETGLLRRSANETFLCVTDYFNLHPNKSGLIFLIGGFSFLIIYTTGAVYVFDSHSRDRNGFASPSGTSILMKFRSLVDVEGYIRQVYLINNNNEELYYQIQYFDINIPPESCLVIQSSLFQARQRSWL